MIKFSKEKVLLLHQIISEATGGSIGVRDWAEIRMPQELLPILLTENSFILNLESQPPENGYGKRFLCAIASETGRYISLFPFQKKEV